MAKKASGRPSSRNRVTLELPKEMAEQLYDQFPSIPVRNVVLRYVVGETVRRAREEGPGTVAEAVMRQRLFVSISLEDPR